MGLELRQVLDFREYAGFTLQVSSELQASNTSQAPPHNYNAL